MGYKLNPFIISVLGFNSLIIIRMKPPKKQRKGHENVKIWHFDDASSTLKSIDHISPVFTCIGYIKHLSVSHSTTESSFLGLY